MARIKLGIKGIYTGALLEKGNHIYGSLQKHSSYFQNPVVPLPVFRQSLDELFDAYQAAKTQLNMIVTRKQCEAVVREQIRLLCNYVANLSMGNPVRIREGGFDFIERNGRIGAPSPVEQMRVTFTKGFSGQLKIQYRRSRGASSYILKMQSEPGGEFREIAVISQVRYIVKNLIPGRIYSFTCTPIGTAGLGGVSPVVSCMAI